MIIEYIMPVIDGIMDIFSQGGIITYIILFVGVYGLIISFRKIAYLKKISRVDTTEIFGVVTASMERGGAVEALKQINGFKNPISRIISETLKIGYKNKVEVEESMEQIFIVEVAKMTKGLSTIKTITELAPFLGLIGTVIGIWMTFKSLVWRLRPWRSVKASTVLPRGVAPATMPTGAVRSPSASTMPRRMVSRADSGATPLTSTS